MSCGIYKIENKNDHNIYIGQSIDIENRFNQHKNKKDNYDIHIAIQEQGVENFTFEIIELCNKDELNEREKYWIAYYDSYNNGYNMTPGGCGWDSTVEATKIRVGQYNLLGNFIQEFESISEAERQTEAGHISDVLNKNDHQSGGYLWISLKDRKENFPKQIKPYIYNTRKTKKIYQINKDTNEIIQKFNSIKEAAQALNMSGNGTHICAVLKGKRNIAGGYKWKEVEE